jgi:hypothetical protein
MVKKTISRCCPFYQLFLSAFKVQFTAWDTAFLKYEVIQDAAKLFHVHRTGDLGAINFFIVTVFQIIISVVIIAKKLFPRKGTLLPGQWNRDTSTEYYIMCSSLELFYIILFILFFYIISIILSTETLSSNKGVFSWIFLGAVEGLYCKNQSNVRRLPKY